MVPADESDLRTMLSAGLQLNGPVAIRYPRATATTVSVPAPADTTLAIGKAEIRRRGRGIAILAFGTLLKHALVVGEELDATVVNMRFVKPLDQELVLELARSHELLVTIEENALSGGAGSAVSELLAAAGLPTRQLSLGLPDRFIEHGDRAEILAECGLDASGMRTAILRIAPRQVAPRVETA